MIDEKIKRRFLSKIKKDLSGCWLWTGKINVEGYGNFWVSKDKPYNLAHRISWLIHYGEIPNELCVLHKCDVRNCVKPKHLFLGDRNDNNQDMMRKGRFKHGVCGKLSEEQVILIREDVRSIAVIALDYLISTRMVYYIKSKERHRSL